MLKTLLIAWRPHFFYFVDTTTAPGSWVQGRASPSAFGRVRAGRDGPIANSGPFPGGGRGPRGLKELRMRYNLHGQLLGRHEHVSASHLLCRQLHWPENRVPECHSSHSSHSSSSTLALYQSTTLSSTLSGCTIVCSVWSMGSGSLSRRRLGGE